MTQVTYTATAKAEPRLVRRICLCVVLAAALALWQLEISTTDPADGGPPTGAVAKPAGMFGPIDRSGPRYPVSPQPWGRVG